MKTIFEQLKSKTSIQDLEELYPDLIKFDSQGRSKSPFKPDESTPSFIICEGSDMVSCFSQGKLGMDIIKVVEELEKVGPVDAAKIINDKLNLNLIFKYDDSEKSLLYREAIKTMEIAKQNLTESSIEYLESRGLGRKLIEDTGIGQIGNKIYFPLFDNTNGKVIGWNARNLSDVGPKYIHSQASLIFNKKEFLGNFHAAKKMNKSTVVLTEGLIDCLVYNQHNTPVICCLGTAFNSTHSEKILKHFSHIILAFDDDDVGKKATLSAYKLLKNVNPNCYIWVASLGGCKDVNEFYVKKPTGDIPCTTMSNWMHANNYDLTELCNILAYNGNVHDLYRDVNEAASLYKVPSTEDLLKEVRLKQGRVISAPISKPSRAGLKY